MSRSHLFGASLLALASAAPAQVIPVPLDNSSIAPQPTPTPTPTPTPEPTATPEPIATPTATAPDPVATPVITFPRRTRPFTGAPARVPAPAITPTLPPAPLATPVAPPTPTATPEPIITVVKPPERRPAATGAPLWPWLFGGAALLTVLAAMLLRRRRPAPEVEDEPYVEEIAAPADPLPQPPTVYAPPPLQRARLAVDLRPTRAGLNLLTATVDSEITVTNTGIDRADNIRVAVALLSAGGNEEGLAAFNTAPIGRSTTPPFALAPGEERRFRAVAALPHAHIRPLSAGGRPIFVPLVATTLRYLDGSVERRTSQAWGVGVERADSPKLAPFWLDVPARHHDTVAARVQGPIEEG